MRTLYLSPARRNAVLSGIAAGSAAVAVLTVLAVLGLRPSTPVAAPTAPATALPSLRTALLEGGDLPASFEVRPTPTAVRTPKRTERCQSLVADPASLLRSLLPRPDASPSPVTARHVGADDGVLDQAVQIFARGQATSAVDTIRKTAKSCGTFTARLDDGTKARVKLTSTSVESLLIGDAYTVSMTLTTKSGQQTGYLAVSRVGDTVSVLRRTGPSGGPALDRQIQDLVGKALDKLVVLGDPRLVGTAPAHR
ncbi:MAG: hypothetical protein HOU81_14800 [Hamadaea sp.]|uniref:hypothetical protein n=1 Tax=Hamadaea sp. TaxID=2024425 RepID=UPI0017B719DD|nr:hypothetical protein [Hamadaea sp.]NUR72082.1 hypothetical protein [Hamadaea sp.]NUT21884.1 hypothetical protein [Hamadaea sp.]